MKEISSWFKPREGELQKLQILQDPSKAPIKRYSALTSLFTAFKRHQEAPKLRKLFCENPNVIPTLCMSELSAYAQHQRARPSDWPDISLTLNILIGFTSCILIEPSDPLQEISNLCLFDFNRWEIKKLGFLLTLELLNHSMDLDLPFHLLICSIDFSLFKKEEHLEDLFPSRTSLEQQDETGQPSWFKIAQDSLKKSSVVAPEVRGFSKSPELLFKTKERECLYFFSRVLEYSILEPGESPAEDRKCHFMKWFTALKGSLLFLLYPKRSAPSAKMCAD